jgi:ESS family glutamate:Na+ symporter
MLIFLGLGTIFSLLQNLVAIGLAKPLVLSPQLAMMRVSTFGLTGFAMGSTANAMANLDSICEKFGYSRVAYFILPVVGALFIDFIDFINVLMITGFLAFL